MEAHVASDQLLVSDLALRVRIVAALTRVDDQVPVVLVVAVPARNDDRVSPVGLVSRNACLCWAVHTGLAEGPAIGKDRPNCYARDVSKDSVSHPASLA